MPQRDTTIYHRITNHLLEVSLDETTWVNIIDAEETMNEEQLALIDDLLHTEFGLTNELIKIIKLLGSIIKQQFLINFYYESHVETKMNLKHGERLSLTWLEYIFQEVRKEKFL